MTDSLKKILNYVTKFDDKEFDAIAKCFRSEFIEKGEMLLRHGDICGKFYIVIKGCIRVFFTNQKGDEKTRYIMPNSHMGTALTSFITQKPSFEQIDALDNTYLFSISHRNFFMLNDQLKQWNLFYQTILEMAYAFQTYKIESLVTQSAKERFDHTMKETPELFQIVSNKILASYLDMTPETLSRIKST